ncbi:MAG: hypothetical protein AAF740_07345 [Bacteroidota bacterium]
MMKSKIFFSIASVLLGVIISVSAQGQPDESGAIDAYVEATGLEKAKKFNEAISKFDVAISKDGENPKYHFEKGRVLLTKMRDADRGVAALKKSIEINESYLDSHKLLARYFVISKKYEEAIIYLDNSFKYEDDKEAKLKYKIEILEILDEQLGQIKKAGNHVNDAKQVAADDPRTLFYESKYYNAIGDYEKAKQAAMKSVEIVADRELNEKAPAYYELGLAYYHLEEYQKMEEAFAVAKQSKEFAREVIRRSPQYFYTLARTFYRVYEIDEAATIIEKVLKMRPDYQRAHELKVQIVNQRVNKKTVIEHLKQALEAETNPLKRAEKLAELSELEIQAGLYADAIEHADQCLQIDAKNYAVTFFKGIAYYKSGIKANSTDEINKGIETLSGLISYKGIDLETKAQYSFALGLFYEKIAEMSSNKGELKKAVESFKAANYGTFKYSAQEKIQTILEEGKS